MHTSSDNFIVHSATKWWEHWTSIHHWLSNTEKAISILRQITGPIFPKYLQLVPNFISISTAWLETRFDFYQLWWISTWHLDNFNHWLDIFHQGNPLKNIWYLYIVWGSLKWMNWFLIWKSPPRSYLKILGINRFFKNVSVDIIWLVIESYLRP